MKIKAKDDYALQKLRDWKKYYVADRLGVTTTEVGQLMDGKTIEVKKANVTMCPSAITVLLREVETKAAKPKGTEE